MARWIFLSVWGLALRMVALARWIYSFMNVFIFSLGLGTGAGGGGAAAEHISFDCSCSQPVWVAAGFSDVALSPGAWHDASWFGAVSCRPVCPPLDAEWFCCASGVGSYG